MKRKTGWTYFVFMIALLFIVNSGCDETGSKYNSAIMGQVPSYPTWIEASDGLYKNRIEITWEYISNAESYTILRSNTGEQGTYSKSFSEIPATTFFDEDVEPGASYYYKVKAVNSAGMSDSYKNDRGSTRAEDEEDVVTCPSTIKATQGIYADRIQVSWEDKNVDGYNVYRKEGDQGTYVLVAESFSSTIYNDVDVESGVHYFYKVASVNDGLVSEFSVGAEGYADAPTDLLPGEFYIIMKDIIEHVWGIIDENKFHFPMTIPGEFGGEIRITMTVICEGTDGNSICGDSDDDVFVMSVVELLFDNYNHDGHINNGTLVLELDEVLCGSETGTLTVTGAHDAKAEFYIDISQRPDGHAAEQGGYYMITSGGVTERVNWQAPDPLVLDAPQSVVASDGSYYGYVEITWDIVPRALEYKIYRCDFAYGNYVEIADGIAVTRYRDYTVEAGASYYYKVRAFYGDEIESDFSDWNQGSSAIVPDLLEAPTGVHASDGTSTDRVTIGWTEVPGAEYYRVFRDMDPEGDYAAQCGGDLTDVSYIDLSVESGKQYYYRIKAYSGELESVFSSYDSGYAGTAADVPDAPLNVSATDRSDNDTNRVTVTWDAVTGASSYRVYRSESPDNGYELISGTSVTGTMFYDTTVDLDTVYCYRVKAVNGFGESEFSDYDQGNRELTVEEFYYYRFRPASKYAKNRIYERFPDPYVGDEATFYGDVSGSMDFNVYIYTWSLLYGFLGRTNIHYNSINDGDLDPTTTDPDETGLILTGLIKGNVWEKSGNGSQSGTLEITGAYEATCVYDLTIEDKITTGGTITVTYNDKTEIIDYVNTDDE